MSQSDPSMDEPTAQLRAVRSRWPLVLCLVGALLVAIAWLSRADAAEPHACREGYIEAFNRGDALPCSGLLVQPATLAGYQAAVDKLPSLEAEKAALEAQLVNLRGELAEARATGEALLKVSEATRAACELSRLPPKCSEPPWGKKPSFVWPTALAVGFFGGFAFDRYVVGCNK